MILKYYQVGLQQRPPGQETPWWAAWCHWHTVVAPVVFHVNGVFKKDTQGRQDADVLAKAPHTKNKANMQMQNMFRYFVVFLSEMISSWYNMAHRSFPKTREWFMKATCEAHINFSGSPQREPGGSRPVLWWDLGFVHSNGVWNDVWKLVIYQQKKGPYSNKSDNRNLWNLCERKMFTKIEAACEDSKTSRLQSWFPALLNLPCLSISGTWSKARVVQLKRIRKQVNWRSASNMFWYFSCELIALQCF